MDIPDCLCDSERGSEECVNKIENRDYGLDNPCPAVKGKCVSGYDLNNMSYEGLILLSRNCQAEIPISAFYPEK